MTPAPQPPKSLADKWERILRDEGLSVNRGAHQQRKAAKKLARRTHR